MAEPSNMAAFDRPPVIERLHNNVGKRKSTTPQKFVGGFFFSTSGGSRALMQQFSSIFIAFSQFFLFNAELSQNKQMQLAHLAIPA